MKLSIQLYSLRAEREKDFVGVLEYVAKLGFQGVEFAGYYGLSAEEIRAHLDRLGLVCSSTHTPAPDVFEKTEETIAINKTLGCKYVIVPWYEIPDAAAAASLAEKFLAVKEKFAENGLVLGYHNHGAEFNKENDTYLLDTLMAKTNREIVMELDTYWSAQAGVNTPQYMLDHQGILPLIHLKDGDGENLTSIGEGKIDIQKVLDTAKAAGVDWVVVENDDPKPNGFEDAKRSMENLKSKYIF